MISVPVVLDRANLGTSQVDAVVEAAGCSLVGITVAQTRRLLRGEPLPFQNRAGFEQRMPS